jgi:hypothetical protein
MAKEPKLFAMQIKLLVSTLLFIWMIDEDLALFNKSYDRWVIDHFDNVMPFDEPFKFIWII